jgi:ribosomal-protein-alanine N-acetyltransferase
VTVVDVTLRTGTEEDREFVGTLSREAFRPYGDLTDVLTQWLTDPSVQTVLAEEAAGRRVGFALLAERTPAWLAPSRGGELLAVAVSPGRRRRGIGRLLVREVERRARAAHMRELRLSTAASNLAARRLYATLGFAVSSRRAPAQRAGHSMLEMAKRL